jgi:LemA protein
MKVIEPHRTSSVNPGWILLAAVTYAFRVTWAYTIIPLLIALVAAIWLFNGLVKGRNLVDAAWADIDVQLQRRHDLVPRLVKVVRGYAKHEGQTLASVLKRRDQAMRARSVGEKSAIEGDLGQGLHGIIALAEAYPDLKAGENFSQLAKDLVEIEDHLQFARRFYNGATRDFNNRVERFPDQLVAKSFGFKSAEFFQAESHARGAVKVALDPS